MIHLLIVDDDDINIFLIKQILKKSSHAIQAISFTDPVEALNYIKKNIAEGKSIDLLLLDINMPLLNGWDVLKELRINGKSILKRTKVYMLSSSLHKADHELSNKFDEVSGFISKPLSHEHLSEIFREIN
jgi:CheY-like chemotaxis protein